MSNIIYRVIYSTDKDKDEEEKDEGDSKADENSKDISIVRNVLNDLTNVKDSGGSYQFGKNEKSNDKGSSEVFDPVGNSEGSSNIQDGKPDGKLSPFGANGSSRKGGIRGSSDNTEGLTNLLGKDKSNDFSPLDSSEMSKGKENGGNVDGDSKENGNKIYEF